MSAGETVLSLCWPIDLGLTVASHGWAYLAPWRWDSEAGRLARHERIGDRLGMIEIAQQGPYLALGYRLTRLREKLEHAARAA